jgi:hypothetical protein
MKVLYIASNPSKATSLGLEREITDLQRNVVATSGEPPRFVFLPGLPFEDLPARISKERPDILHVSAHGEKSHLTLSHGGQDAVSLTGEPLSAFLDVEPMPKFVYLNACDSKSIAKTIIDRVPMAIGTTASITNRAARAAAVNFYSRLLDGKSVASAFKVGQMIMKGIDNGAVTSELFRQTGVNPARVFLHVPCQLLARFWKDDARPRGRDYLVEVGLSGWGQRGGARTNACPAPSGRRRFDFRMGAYFCLGLDGVTAKAVQRWILVPVTGRFVLLGKLMTAMSRDSFRERPIGGDQRLLHCGIAAFGHRSLVRWQCRVGQCN